MIRYQEECHLPHTPERLFELVANVEAYPQFIMGCQNVEILQRNAHGFLAEVQAGYGPFSETYQCQVNLEPFHRIHVKSVQGPFEHLETVWQFQDKGEEGCLLSFAIEFCFKKSLFQSAMSSMFQGFSEQMVRAFQERAQQVYP